MTAPQIGALVRGEVSFLSPPAARSSDPMTAPRLPKPNPHLWRKFVDESDPLDDWLLDAPQP